MKRFAYYLLPAPIRLLARRLYYLPVDTFDYVSGKRPGVVPPKGIISTGYSEYLKQGEKFLTYFKELAGLKPNHAVLDVGCEIGRMAVPLTRFLKDSGSYDGFDSAKSKIDWCNKHISIEYPNFRFSYTGLYNHTSNTSHKALAGNFIFPYPDEKFDFVFLTSIFTHLLPDEVAHYINEISRVMKHDATCLMSFYMVNCESEDLMIKKPTDMTFPFNKGFYRLTAAQVDNAKVAYDEEWLLEKLGNAGLKMKSIQYGQWCGRKYFLDYADLLICSKV